MPTTYEVHPAVDFWPMLTRRLAPATLSPATPFWYLMLGGEGVTSNQLQSHSVPGLTPDGYFPDDWQPQLRLNVVVPAPMVYALMYHGVPGVSLGDDNWPNTMQPQLRLNTMPHTADPPAEIVGTWKVNEAFLAP